MKHCPATVFMVCAAILSGCSVPVCASASGPQKRIIHNNDGTDMLGNYWFGGRPLSVEDVNAAVDMVAGTQVTTYMMCTGSSAVYYPSKYSNMLGDDRGGTLKHCYDSATYNLWRRYWDNEKRLEAEGTDMVSASLTRARERGLETFITLRMNDLHFADTLTACKMAMEDFWLRNPQFWTNDPSIGYNSAGALDYAHPEVRAHKLALIREQLTRFGPLIDGIDLDFMRFFVYFRADEALANAPLMTEFVSDVRTLVDSCAASLGRPLLLSARVAPTLSYNMEKGLDVAEWVRLGLLDFISIGTHWRGDPSIPAGSFRHELAAALNGSRSASSCTAATCPLPIPLYASIDDGGFRSSLPGAPREFWTHGAFRGMASALYEQGADGLYLFNYYFGQFQGLNGGSLTLEPGTLYCRTISPELLNELGSPETLRRRNKVYALSEDNVQYGIHPNTPFPLRLRPVSGSSPESVAGKGAAGATVAAEGTDGLGVAAGTDGRGIATSGVREVFDSESVRMAQLVVGDNVLEDRPLRALLFVRKTPGECRVCCNGTLLSAPVVGFAELADGLTPPQKAAQFQPEESTAKIFGKDLNLSPGQEVLVLEVPVESLRQGLNSFTFSALNSSQTLFRLELAVIYGPVATNGYL